MFLVKGLSYLVRQSFIAILRVKATCFELKLEAKTIFSGCTLADPSGPWNLIFGWLGDVNFFLTWYAGHPGFGRFRALGSLQLVTHSLILGGNWSKNLIKGGNHLSSNRLLHWPIISFYWNQYHHLSITGTRVAVVASEGSKTWFYQIWEQLQNTLSLWSCIPERARYMNMQLCLLCTFLPSVA